MAYQIDEYTASGGRKALSLKVGIDEMARFPQVTSQHRSSLSEPHIEAVQRKAIRDLESYEMPSTLRSSARRAARHLTNTFQKVADTHTVLDQTSGKLDRRKLRSVAKHTAMGTYNTRTVRPYKRNELTPSKLPTIAIVASAGNAEMHSDRTYISRVMGLTLGIRWACDAAGLESYAALTQEHCEIRRGTYSEAIQAFMMAEPGKHISPVAYGVALATKETWQWGVVSTLSADDAAYAKHKEIRYGVSSPANSWPAYNGGNSVSWAKNHLGADIVISIGNNSDRNNADINLASDFTIEDAVAEIVKQAKKL